MNRAGWLALLVLVADPLSTLAAEQDRPAPAAWKQVEPGGGTSCGLGTPYRFFHRDGADPERLVIYFQGGGACWNWVSCSGMFDTRVDADEMAQFRGLFATGGPPAHLLRWPAIELADGFRRPLGGALTAQSPSPPEALDFRRARGSEKPR